ncbi:hypothetical protein [Streptomyces sp. NPDC001970]
MSSDSNRPAADTEHPHRPDQGHLLHWMVTGGIVVAGLTYVAHEHPSAAQAMGPAFGGGTLLLGVVIAVTRRR